MFCTKFELFFIDIWKKKKINFGNVGTITLYNNSILVWFYFILCSISDPNTTCLIYTHMIILEIHFVQYFDTLSKFLHLGYYYRSIRNAPE